MPNSHFAIHDGAKDAIDAAAIRAFDAVRTLDVAQSGPDRFPSDIVVAATITDADIIGEPVSWLPLASGERAFVFASVNGAENGYY